MRQKALALVVFLLALLFIIPSVHAGSGTISVTIQPPEVNVQGAQWRAKVDGPGGGWTAWTNSGGSQTLEWGGAGAKGLNVQFSNVPGWTRPAAIDIMCPNGGSVTTEGTYVLKVGSLQVAIDPAEAVAAGAQWTIDSGTTWYNSGDILIDMQIGDYLLEFKEIYGWDTPAARNVEIQEGITTNETGIYVRQTGFLRVTVEPEAARLDGALWGFVDEPVPARNSGDSVLLNVDSYGIHFNDLAGWETPGVQVVGVLANATVDATGTYLPKPVLLTPANGAFAVSVSPALEAAEIGPGLLPPGFAHNASHWQISTSDTFAPADLVLDATNAQLRNFADPALTLQGNTVHWWRVKYLDTVAGLESGWADPFSFTTEIPPIPGDVNGDGRVAPDDLRVIRAIMGSRLGQPKYIAEADMNRDGVITSTDITLWYKAYNNFLAGRY